MSDNSTSKIIGTSLRTAARLSRLRTRLAARIQRADQSVRRTQNARLLSGGAFVLALFTAAFRPGWQIPLPAALIFAPVFAALVVRSRRWTKFHLKLVRLDAFFARQESRCLGRAPIVPNHFEHEKIGADLDYFGDFSLWTLLDETITDEGSKELKSWITQPSLELETIVNRQETVRSLKPDHWFYTRLTLIAERSELRQSSRQVLDFLARARAAKSLPFTLSLTAILWITWLVMIVRQMPGASLVYFGFLVANFSAIGKSGDIFKSGVGVSNDLSLLTPVFSLLEKRTRVSPQLARLAPMSSAHGPSEEAKSLNFAVGLLGTSANPIVHLAINAATPWTLVGLFLLERARRKLDSSFATCLSELARLEALFSLVIFERYQTQTYPTLSAARLSARGVFHPLVSRAKIVANDFEFASGKSLGLLTGSNMSGKSTFLRTVGLNQTLANMGAAVFADAFATRPLYVESCIEVSDSLRDGFSYFYAEVRRLKALLDAAKRGHVLYLIDEIFRGTNNRERQIGSRAVIEALADSPDSEGFVSTHDLELTSLEAEEPAVLNLHFRENIEEGRMIFSYRLQPGASPTTNALRIMQLEGLPVDATGL